MCRIRLVLWRATGLSNVLECSSLKTLSLSSSSSVSGLGKDWGDRTGGEGGCGVGDLWWCCLSGVANAHAGEVGGQREHGSPLTLGCFGCDEEDASRSIFPWSSFTMEDSRGLRQGGDLTTHEPVWLPSPSSSSLMNDGSSCCSACFADPVATFNRFMKSWKKSVWCKWVTWKKHKQLNKVITLWALHIHGFETTDTTWMNDDSSVMEQLCFMFCPKLLCQSYI